MLIIYSNTEEKDTTVNDEMSFAVAERVSEFSYSATTVSFNWSTRGHVTRCSPLIGR